MYLPVAVEYMREMVPEKRLRVALKLFVGGKPDSVRQMYFAGYVKFDFGLPLMAFSLKTIFRARLQTIEIVHEDPQVCDSTIDNG